MSWGFFQKLFVADSVALVVNEVFSLNHVTFPLLWVGVLGFSVQIFADFSGYTDIARGTAKLLGVDLVQNFDHPYLADSPSQFWRRWHMSLSHWIRDYLYIPLGGDRVSLPRYIFNVLLSFGLCGLWHGASWNFVLWGVYHGALTIAYHLCGRLVPKRITEARSLRPWRILFFFVLTNIGWLIFHERNLAYLVQYFQQDPLTTTPVESRLAGFFLANVLFFALPLVIFTATRHMTFRRNAMWKKCALVALFVLLILLFRSQNRSEFIYFQF